MDSEEKKEYLSARLDSLSECEIWRYQIVLYVIFSHEAYFWVKDKGQTISPWRKKQDKNNVLSPFVLFINKL